MPVFNITSTEGAKHSVSKAKYHLSEPGVTFFIMGVFAVEGVQKKCVATFVESNAPLFYR